MPGQLTSIRGEGVLNGDGTPIPYRIGHRPRVTRRIHLELYAEGGLLVVAPRRMSQRAIHRTLLRELDWVRSYLERAQVRHSELPQRLYLDGEPQLYLGRDIRLRVEAAGGHAQPGEDELRVTVREPGLERTREAVRRWYRKQAAVVFAERLAALVPRAWWVEREPPLRLRRMKATWGSCSLSGRITLNTHLVKAPLHLVDYVIAHELCHLREHNHGPRFYALQQQLNPHWRSQRAELRERSHLYLQE